MAFSSSSPLSEALIVLGVHAGATVDDVRAARRRLAIEHHPDRGGDATQMQAVNEAADVAIRAIEQRGSSGGSPSGSTSPTGASTAPGPGSEPTSSAGEAVQPGRSPRADGEPSPAGFARDMPSFVVEALPVEAFEGLLVAATLLGEVLDDEPPYRLEVVLDDPLGCWCRLELVPDAGSSTVSLTIAGIDGAPTPDVLEVRDAWIATLNAIDWD
ncbi:MAG: J domain-containing protein [Ilumatobacteraceae bacterium]